MTVYQHKKGKIRDNAIEALLHDPLFKPRIEVNQKGKGSYRRKDKHAGKGNWEASGKNAKQILTTGFLVSGKKTVFRRFFFSYGWLFCCFNRSRISVSRTSCAGVFAGAASFFLYILFISLIAIKIANATITKSNTV